MVSERLQKMAEQVRGTSIVDPVFDEEYLAYGKRETVERILVPTGEGEVPVFIHRAKDLTRPCRLFINIHGGGFARPLIDTNIHFCSKTAVSIQGVVADIDYSLAPEYPYPVAFHQCYDVVGWVISHAEELGSRADLVCLGGHSAGANLTAAIMLKANQTKDFSVRMQIHDFGAYDMVTDPADKPGTQEHVVPLDRSRAFSEMYTWKDPECVRDPYVSPLLAPDEWLREQPDALIITGGKDAFREEGERYGLRLAANGTKVTIKRFADSPHGFTMNCVGKWRQSQQLIIDTLLSVIP